MSFIHPFPHYRASVASSKTMASPVPWPLGAYMIYRKCFQSSLFGCKLIVPCVLLYIHNGIFKIQPVCRDDSVYLRGLGLLRLKVLVRRPWPAVPGLKAWETVLGVVTLT